MFSIYRRFDGDVTQNGIRGQGQRPGSNIVPASQSRSEPLTNLPPQRPLSLAKTQGSLHSQTKGQAFGSTLAQTQKQGPKGQQTKSLGGQQKALPPVGVAHREEHQKQTHGPHKKPGGFLQGILPSGLYDHGSKKLFGFLAAEDLLLVALIFLLLEKDGEDNTLMIIALIYVLLSDYIDLPELGF